MLKEVESHRAPASGHAVYDRDPAFQMTDVARSRINGNAVLDDHDRHGSVVPHQPVVMGHMHEQHRRVVNRVARGNCVGLRHIMLQVDAGAASAPNLDLELVIVVILRVLEHDGVKIQVAHCFRRHISNVILLE